jgi:hypothetical protein
MADLLVLIGGAHRVSYIFFPAALVVKEKPSLRQGVPGVKASNPFATTLSEETAGIDVVYGDARAGGCSFHRRPQ